MTKDVTAKRIYPYGCKRYINKDNFYLKLIEELPLGYAYIKKICNDNAPCDFIFLEINDAFEKLTGTKRNKLIGKSISELLPQDDLSDYEWIGNYSQTAYKYGKQEFEKYSKLLNKWLRINIKSTKKDFLTMIVTDISKEKEHMLELENSKRRMQNILEGTNVGSWELNLSTGEARRNELWAQMLGYTLEELSPITLDTWRNLVHPDDLLEELKRDEELYDKVIEYYDDEYRMKHKDGSWVWIHDRGKVISWTEEGKPLLVSGTHTNITSRKKLELELANEKNLLKTTLISVCDGVISTDSNGRIIFMNKSAEQLTGWILQEAKDKDFEEVFNAVNGYTREKCENTVKTVLESMKVYELPGHIIIISKDGTERSIENSFAPILQESGEISGVVLVFRDCTEKKKKQEEILFLSYCDQLTGLYNRRFFEERLIQLDNENNLPLTLIIADVNGLKLVNDSFGHALGDELLKKVADILRKGCRNSDVISRMGGDEFVILLTNTDSNQAEQVIKRINKLTLNEKAGAIDISISFGSGTKNQEEEDIREVFKNAEDNMYRKKLYESASIRNKTIDMIMNTLYEKSNREMQHSYRVSRICESLAMKMNLDKDKVNQIKIAGLMHDIGKMGIDEKILNKDEKLNADEWKEIKRHPEIGYRILSSSNEFSEIAEYVLKHHERWDGKGYPGGFRGEEISLQSRIIAIADAYDAMTSDRPYRKGLSEEEAMSEIKRCSGTQFDTCISKVFMEMLLDKQIKLKKEK